MRKYLMAGAATAALMFGLGQAIAQSSMGGGTEKQPGATSTAPAGASGSMDHSKSQGSKTIGQARDQAEPKAAQPSPKMGGSDQLKPATGDQMKQGASERDQSKQNAQRDTDQLKSKSKTTTGQSQDQKSDQMKSDKGMQSPSSGKMGAQPSTNQNNAQAPSSSSSTTKMGQQPSTTQNSAQGSSSTSTTTGSASSSATQLTTEQRTEVREKVLATAPRETNVNFSVNVGTVVPRTVHFATVPEVLIRIHPEWRGHRFFVVRDEIIIVDDQFRIIAVLPV